MKVSRCAGTGWCQAGWCSDDGQWRDGPHQTPAIWALCQTLKYLLLFNTSLWVMLVWNEMYVCIGFNHSRLTRPSINFDWFSSGKVWEAEERPSANIIVRFRRNEVFTAQFIIPLETDTMKRMDRTKRLFVWNNAMIKIVCQKVVRNSWKIKRKF